MRYFSNWLTVLGVFGVLAVGKASAAPLEWDYTVTSEFVTTLGATTFIGAGPGTQNGCELLTASNITWGVCPQGPVGVGRSGIGISDNPQTGTLVANGAAQYANTYTHSNNVVNSSFATLTSATISTTLGLKAKDSSDPYVYETFVYAIRLSETPNGSDPTTCVVPGGTPCSDIWVLDGSVNHTVVMDGKEFTFSFFPEPAADPLDPAICEAAGAEIGCIGFTTEENMASAIRFMMTLTQVAGVSGRVYAEGSGPANTQDDGNAIDTGVPVAVSLHCTNPDYSAGPVDTAADGSFSFENVPAGADCTITTTPPAGFQMAYTQQGTTGESASPGLLDTGVTGSTGVHTITVSVSTEGSTGNIFALRALTDMHSTTVCTPSSAAAGASVSCTTTCTNAGSSTALNAFCAMPNAASLPGSPAAACSAPADVPPNGTLSCTLSFAMAGNASITVAGGTGADNDGNGGADAAAGNNASSAAVTPQVTTPTNPTNPSNPTNPGNPTPVPGLGNIALALLAALIGLLVWRKPRYRAVGRPQ